MSSLPRVLVVVNTTFNVLEKYLKGSDKETLRIKTPTMHTLQSHDDVLDMFRVNGKGMQQEIAQYAFDSYRLQSLFCAYIYHGPCNTLVILLHFLRTWVLKVLLWTSYARLLPLSLIWLYSSVPLSNLWLSSLLECSLQLSGGIITTATFTLMMLSSQNSSPGTKASHSALLATVEVLGKLSMISSSGFLVDVVGYPCFFGFCLFLALLFIPVLRNGKFSASKRSQ